MTDTVVKGEQWWSASDADGDASATSSQPLVAANVDAATTSGVAKFYWIGDDFVSFFSLVSLLFSLFPQRLCFGADATEDAFHTPGTVYLFGRLALATTPLKTEGDGDDVDIDVNKTTVSFQSLSPVL